MVASRIVRFAALPPSRWANGLGETIELWRVPDGGDFRLRLSIATVDSDAPFSPLPGVERALMPLGDSGLTLVIDGARETVARHEVVRFAGEADVCAIDVTSRGLDLNFMVRRGTGEPVLRAVQVDGGQARRGRPPLVYVALGGAVTADGIPLGFGDCVVCGDDGPTLAGSGVVAEARLAIAGESPRPGGA